MHKMIRKCTWDCMNQSRSYSIDGNLNILSFNCINRYTICCLGDLRYDRAAAAVVTASSSQKSSTFLPPLLLTMPHCLKITKKSLIWQQCKKNGNSTWCILALFGKQKFIHLIIVFFLWKSNETLFGWFSTIVNASDSAEMSSCWRCEMLVVS